MKQTHIPHIDLSLVPKGWIVTEFRRPIIESESWLRINTITDDLGLIEGNGKYAITNIKRGKPIETVCDGKRWIVVENKTNKTNKKPSTQRLLSLKNDFIIRRQTYTKFNSFDEFTIEIDGDTPRLPKKDEIYLYYVESLAIVVLQAGDDSGVVMKYWLPLEKK